MSKELTIERLAEAIIKTTKEVRQLKAELEKVQSYLREQHKLRKQLNNKK
jgi:AmiR/NasT family two-component response regulator